VPLLTAEATHPGADPPLPSADGDDERLVVRDWLMDGRRWIVVRGQLESRGLPRLGAALAAARRSTASRLILDTRAVSLASDPPAEMLLALLHDHQITGGRWRVLASDALAALLTAAGIPERTLRRHPDLDATRADGEPRMSGCPGCARIWSPARAPVRCPDCSVPCIRMDMPEIAALIFRRRRQLRAPEPPPARSLAPGSRGL
jgi:hypothetical protein